MSQCTPPPATRSRAWLMDMTTYVVALAVFLAAFAVLGIGFEADTFTCFVWGRQLANGLPMDPVNPVFTSPKILIVLLAAAGQAVPGERGAEYAYAFLVAAAGAGIVVLTSRLARRIGGTMAAVVAALLTMGHVDLLRHVLTGQSPIFASLFLLGVLLLATRQEVRVRDYFWGGALVFAASLARPEAAVLAGPLAVALYARLGWRRPFWPAVVLAFGAAGVAAVLLFNQFGFGSYRYNYELVMTEMGAMGKPLPSLLIGFAKAVTRAVLHYANGLWVMLLLAGVGAGLLVGKDRWRRYIPLFLFPATTVAMMWALLYRGYLINERCLYYMLFIVIALAAGGVGWLGKAASERAEFLTGWPPRWRAVIVAAMAVGVMVPAFASRPLPRYHCGAYRGLEHVGEMLRAKIGDATADRAPLVFDETAQVMYRLRLPTRPSYRQAVHVLRHKEGDLPGEIAYYVTDLMPALSELPATWRLRQVWRDPKSKVALYQRLGATGAEKE